MPRQIHIPGQALRIGMQVRQRCAWCGATLIDVDLSMIAVPEGQDPMPDTWEPGALVAVDGPASCIVEHHDGDKLPADACGQIDHEVTR